MYKKDVRDIVLAWTVRIERMELIVEFISYLKDHFIVFDGAMGTMLQNAGLKPGEVPETFNILHPEIVSDIHKQYVKAGADVVTTNTFQSNELKLKDCPYSVEEIITQGVKIAKDSGAKWVALDIGPLEQQMEPMGTISCERVYEIFKRQIIAGAKVGADLVLIETFYDLHEAKAAVLAAKENCSLPVLCTMTFQTDGRTFMGTDPKTATLVLQDLGVDVIGANCSFGPKELLPVVSEFLKYSKVPVMAQPNAGLPTFIGEKAVYNITPEEFSSYISTMAELGVKIVGGCCGTNPEFIKKLKHAIANL